MALVLPVPIPPRKSTCLLRRESSNRMAPLAPCSTARILRPGTTSAPATDGVDWTDIPSRMETRGGLTCPGGIRSLANSVANGPVFIPKPPGMGCPPKPIYAGDKSSPVVHTPMSAGQGALALQVDDHGAQFGEREFRFRRRHGEDQIH